MGDRIPQVTVMRRSREVKMTWGRLIVRFAALSLLIGLNVSAFFVFQEAQRSATVTTVTGVATVDAHTMGDGTDVSKVSYEWGEDRREAGVTVPSTVIEGDAVTMYMDKTTGEMTKKTTDFWSAFAFVLFICFVTVAVGVLASLPFIDSFD